MHRKIGPAFTGFTFASNPFEMARFIPPKLSIYPQNEDILMTLLIRDCYTVDKSTS